MKDIIILGIETSCDETAAAAVKNGRAEMSNIILSQPEHAKFGGVVPEIAGRGHIARVDGAVKAALAAAGVSEQDISAVAVTAGSGLIGALLVGISFAKGLAYKLNVPLIGVNHIEGHIAANFIGTDLEPPFVCLTASGGHTSVIHVKSYTEQRELDTTIDDAAGEAFDKVARILGFPYPGGAKIDAAGAGGEYNIKFTRPRVRAKISYSGLKTAAINYIAKNKENLNLADFCKSFSAEVLEPLIEKTVSAAKRLSLKKIALSGGVSANSYLRARMAEECKKYALALYRPPLLLCTDNAAMIAARGYYDFINNRNVEGLGFTARL